MFYPVSNRLCVPKQITVKLNTNKGLAILLSLRVSFCMISYQGKNDGSNDGTKANEEAPAKTKPARSGKPEGEAAGNASGWQRPISLRAGFRLTLVEAAHRRLR